MRTGHKDQDKWTLYKGDSKRCLFVSKIKVASLTLGRDDSNYILIINAKGRATSEKFERMASSIRDLTMYRGESDFFISVNRDEKEQTITVTGDKKGILNAVYAIRGFANQKSFDSVYETITSRLSIDVAPVAKPL